MGKLIAKNLPIMTGVTTEACVFFGLVGRIRPELRAGLLAAREDPLADLMAIADVRLVRRDGAVINGETNR